MNGISTILSLVVLLVCCFTNGIGASNIPLYELQALEDLYYSTNGIGWVYPAGSTHWNFSKPDPNPCSEGWAGLTCMDDRVDATLLHINTMNLADFVMIGSLPISLGNLTYLSVLDFSHNSLLNLPDMFGRMKELANVSVQYNRMVGAIPESLWFMDLDSLFLNANKFSGQLSDSIGNLSCRELDLSGNLLNGSLPHTIGNIRGLQSLHLMNNDLTSSLPNSMENLHELAVLDAYGNSFDGTIPRGMMSSLVTIELTGNRIGGNLTSLFENATFLVKFLLRDNQLTGPFPTKYDALKNLEYLDISGNLLTGSLPPNIGDMTNLVQLVVDVNDLSDSIPDSLFTLQRLSLFSCWMSGLTGALSPLVNQMPALTSLELSWNHFRGELPELTGCTNLYSFLLTGNEFSGSLPDLQNLPLIRYVSADSNQFEGSIPDSYCHGIIYELDVSTNQLTGSIPWCIGTYGAPYPLLNLNDNFFEGTLPASIYNITSGLSSGLFFANNLLSGTLPEAGFSKLDPYMETVQLNNNLFSGSIPQTLATFAAAVVMNLEHNQFTGKFPTLDGLYFLETLFINNNQFTGRLANVVVLDDEQRMRLINFDASNNQFTGPIPTTPFLIQRFQTFAAVSNCLTGSIPEVVCNASSLLTLALDGLRSASSCQQRFFPGSWGVDSYLLDGNIGGGVPECLFSLPNLNILHLSGNGLSGSIPRFGDVNNLTDLSLSHNNLRGTIPDVIQMSSWSNLDLSFNKIGGVLQAFTPEYAKDSSLSLQVNRLSGDVPSVLREMKDISILDSNLFGCGTTRSDLPTHDPDSSDYECGSNTFNFALYAWLSVFGIVSSVLLGLMLLKRRHPESTDGDNWRTVFRRSTTSLSVVQLGVFLDQFRVVSAYLVLFILCVVLPVNSVLSVYYDTYSHEYAWSITSAYLSGVAPAVVLLIVLLALVVFIVLVARLVTRKNRDVLECILPHRNTLKQRLTVALVVLVDVVVMTGVNFAYVYIHNSYDSNVVQISQLSVALFKIAWNNFAVRGILKLYRSFAYQNKTHETNQTDEEFRAVPLLGVVDVHPASEPVTGFNSIGVAVAVMLFNNLAAPFVATAFVSSNCFYDVITTPPVVTVSYLYSQCEAYTVTNEGTVCVSYAYGNDVRSTSYAPPFSYSYQCSSTFITTYAAIYVFMFILMGFFAPLLQVFMAWLQETTAPGTGWNKIALSILPRILKPYSESIISSWKETAIFSLFDVAFSSRLFDGDVFVVQLVNMLVVLITFGVVVPPLALVVLISIYSVTYFTQWCIGRFIVALNNATWDVKPNQVVVLLAGLESDCSGAREMLRRSIRLLVPFVVMFYSFFLFDILGDQVGWRKAIWLPVSLLVLPSVVWLFRRYAQYTVFGRMTRESRRSWGSDRKSELDEEAAGIDEELLAS